MADGLAQLIGRFDLLLVDLWGVLHAGGEPFPEALDALARAQAAGRRAVLVSNSSRDREEMVADLRRQGVDPGLFAAVVSSGGLVRRHLEGEPQIGLPPLAGRFWLCAGHGMPAWVRRLAGRRADTVEAASFVLVTGVPQGEAAERLEDRLAAARARGLPLVLANNDRVVPQPGRLAPGPAVVGDRYAALGGQVLAVGKPERAIYAAALAAGGAPSDRPLAIGDNLETDVAGAAGFGMPSLMVVETGVHGAELMAGGAVDPAAARRLFARHGVAPDWMTPRLCWGEAVIEGN